MSHGYQQYSLPPGIETANAGALPPPPGLMPSPYHQLPPPPPSDAPPLPPGPPPPMQHCSPETAHMLDRAPPSVPQLNEFSFRINANAPSYPNNPPPSHDRYRYRPDNRQPARRNHDNRRQNTRDPRPAWRGTADRPLLTYKRGSTPEQLSGMVNNGGNRFMDIDDLSDSVEEPMDESDAEDDNSLSGAGATEVVEEVSAIKKQRLSTDTQDGDEAPKWTNAELYTVLPPQSETTGKKRDIVKLIRKARVAAEKSANIVNQVTTNDNYISFDFGDDEHASGNKVKNDPDGQGVPGAPSGPRSFSHLKSLHSSAAQRPHQAVVEVSTTTVHTHAPLDLTDSIVQHLDASRGSGQKRKRSVESADERIPLRPRYQKSSKAFNGGFVLEEWRPIDGQNPIPWISRSHQMTENAGFRLHKEICDFYEFVRPQSYEQAMRSALLERLNVFIKHEPEECIIYSFGSFAAGLYLPNADMDIVITSRTFRETGRPVFCQSGTKMFKLARSLEDAGIAERKCVEVIHKAKVPIIKFVDKLTGLRVDVSFENSTGTTANSTFATWKSQYPAMPIVVTLIKQFLMMRGLNEVVNGGIGGFTVTCLVTSLLQHMPRIKSGELKAEENLGEILLEFLDFYGNQFDLNRVGIEMEPPKYVDKAYSKLPSKNDRLLLLDPNRKDNDISGGSRQIAFIFERFSHAREEILRAMRSPSRISLLDWMLGGNYESFLWHRFRLRQLHDDQFNSGGGQRPRTSTNKIHQYNPDRDSLATAKDKAQAVSAKIAKTVKQHPNTKQHNLKDATVAKKQQKTSTSTTPNDSTEIMAQQQRAQAFVVNHPHVPGVPSQLTKKQAQELLKRYPHQSKET